MTEPTNQPPEGVADDCGCVECVDDRAMVALHDEAANLTRDLIVDDVTNPEGIGSPRNFATFTEGV